MVSVMPPKEILDDHLLVGVQVSPGALRWPEFPDRIVTSGPQYFVQLRCLICCGNLATVTETVYKPSLCQQLDCALPSWSGAGGLE